MRTHQEIDARSLELHRLYAQRIRENPQLFSVVQDNIAFLLKRVAPGGRGYILEWQKAAEEGLEPCLRLAVADTERSTALRQSSPFAGVISQEERLNFLRHWKAAHEPSSA
jgi:hypothetical protein